MQQLTDLLEANLTQLKGLSAATAKQFEEFQIKAAEDLLQLTSRPFEKAFDTGDKRAVRTWLKRQGEAEGVEEVSVLNEHGPGRFFCTKALAWRWTEHSGMGTGSQKPHSGISDRCCANILTNDIAIHARQRKGRECRVGELHDDKNGGSHVAELMDAIQERRSIRQCKEKKVPDELLGRIL